jgi:hypothetical protein
MLAAIKSKFISMIVDTKRIKDRRQFDLEMGITLRRVDRVHFPKNHGMLLKCSQISDDIGD